MKKVKRPYAHNKELRKAHRKHIKENRGGRDDRPAGTPGATNFMSKMTKLPKLRTEPPLPLVRLMQSHSPAALAGIPNLGTDVPDMGRPRPWQYTVADYEVRQRFKRSGKRRTTYPDAPWGIYLRAYNVCLAEFAPNSAALRDALARMFDAAHARKQSEIAKFKDARTKLPKRHTFRHVSDGD